jgi:hypothetical protein
MLRGYRLPSTAAFGSVFAAFLGIAHFLSCCRVIYHADD